MKTIEISGIGAKFVIAGSTFIVPSRQRHHARRRRGQRLLAIVETPPTIAVDAINSIIHAYVRFLAKRSGFDPEEIRIAPMQPPNIWSP